MSSVNKTGWGVFPDRARPKVRHVIPLNDADVHSAEVVFCIGPSGKGNKFTGGYTSTCPCQPDYEIADDWIIVVHDAFDGRLGVEWANEILNEKPIKDEN